MRGHKIDAVVLLTLGACSFDHGYRGGMIDANGTSGGDGRPADAFGTGLDAAPGTNCYGPGSGPWRVCLGSAPSGNVSLPASVDTDTSMLCLQAQPSGWTAGGQPASCFIVGNSIMAPNSRVTGSRPLVLLASASITINVLDLASHVGSTASGPGAQPSACKPFASNPTAMGDGNGGGAGGSFMTAGAQGGGGNGGEAQGGSPATADGAAPAVLRGGCQGQAGAGGPGGVAGQGGGAAYLLAGSSIAITGLINASGASGSVGSNNKPGGGGGGSGGMLVFYAPTITNNGSVFANGGSGGGGESGSGQSGMDPVALQVPAAGGSPNGGSGYALNVDATAGTDNDGGGGGGGAGAGYIRANKSISTTSPPASIIP